MINIAVKLLLIILILTCNELTSQTSLPAPGNNKVAYYVFDSGGPDHHPLTTFTDEANIVVIFEGTLWELADSAHYNTGWMTTTNRNYHFFSEIIRDIRILQSRGIKVLMNVDDNPFWSTATPFTTYDGTQYSSQQFAEFIKYCAIDVLQLDGISLDIEHKATGNAEYITLLKEIGKYFGLLSENSDSHIYTAAIYSGGAPGSVIGKSPEVAVYFNFVMDMGYWQPYDLRFNQWADFIGDSKVMVGVLNDHYDLDMAMEAAAWQPENPPKAGIMVFAANNLKSYADAVFRALNPVAVHENQNNIPVQFALLQNYPNPFNPVTNIEFRIADFELVILKIYDILGNEIATIINEEKSPGTYKISYNASSLASGIYFYRITAGDFMETKSMILVK